MKNILVPIILLSILLGFPSITFAGSFKWTVEYEMDTGDGKKQQITIELPDKKPRDILQDEPVERYYFTIPNLYGEWKCGVYYDDRLIPPDEFDVRTFGCFPIDNFNYRFNAVISCNTIDQPINSLLLQFGGNQLNIDCKQK